MVRRHRWANSLSLGRWTPAATLLLLLLVHGCSPTVQPAQTPFMEALGVEQTTNELQASVREYGGWFAAVVEERADEILAGSTDAEVRRQARLWKIYGIPAGYRAILHDDPLASLGDIWLFSVQMTNYFETGAGSELFGEWQPVAVATSRQLESAATQLARSAIEPAQFAFAQSGIDSVAILQPIESSFFVRRSILPQLQRLQWAGATSAFAAIGRIDLTADQINERVAIINDQMPKQILWQAELLVEELMTAGEVQTALQDFSGLTESVERITAFIEASPELIDAERAATIRALQAELEAVMGSIDEQRIATIEDLRAELVVVLDAVERERVAALAEMDTLASAAVDQAMGEAEGLIDHFFWRLVQFSAVLLVGLAILAIPVLRMLRGRG